MVATGLGRGVREDCVEEISLVETSISSLDTVCNAALSFVVRRTA